MKRVLPIILGTIFIMLTTFGESANAASVTTKQLLTWCQSKNEHQQAACLGYLLALDTYLQFAPYASTTKACVPAETSSDELKELVVVVLQSTHDRQEENASALAIEAIASAFPCPSSFKGGMREARAKADRLDLSTSISMRARRWFEALGFGGAASALVSSGH